MRRIFLAVALVAAILPFGRASAEHNCDESILIDAAGTYYVAVDVPPTGDGSIWIYEESNGQPGLQRGDDSCSGAQPPDTIIF